MSDTTPAAPSEPVDPNAASVPPVEATPESPATDAPAAEAVPAEAPAPVTAAPAATPAAAVPVAPVVPPQTSLASRGVNYAVDIVFCIDVTGSMDPILDAVKANALGFYDDVQTNLTAKGKNVAELRVRVIAFRDLVADGAAAIEESPFYGLPDDRARFSDFVGGLVAEGGGDAPESGLEAVALAIASPWTRNGDRRRQVIVVWSDQPAHPLDPTVVPADLRSRIPADFSALTDAWEDEQGVMGSSTKRLILFAPDGPGWSDISAEWENVVHNPSTAGGGLSDVDYGTIIDSIGNSV
ncbi:vWA domain-containing protein [Curtobacterium sp. MCPF17_050]|uniref:vWA domain-containing protein n=1 Tax=Curtobacterium sp. MCPF17_050 TaxID=2175664 RepID=UPI001C651981|nr:vWA domain-containing protein [Curtobacterium sp. MCPF17_050]WIB15650.1 vWA domain-containing protein [Curtobacterium sp. MCPF17_050]